MDRGRRARHGSRRARFSERPLEASVGQGRGQNRGRRRPAGEASPVARRSAPFTDSWLAFPPGLFAAHERVAHGRLGPTGAACPAGPARDLLEPPRPVGRGSLYLLRLTALPDRKLRADRCRHAAAIWNFRPHRRVRSRPQFRARRRRLPERQRRDPVRSQSRFMDHRARPVQRCARAAARSEAGRRPLTRTCAELHGAAACDRVQLLARARRGSVHRIRPTDPGAGPSRAASRRAAAAPAGDRSRRLSIS